MLQAVTRMMVDEYAPLHSCSSHQQSYPPPVPRCVARHTRTHIQHTTNTNGPPPSLMSYSLVHPS